MEILLIQNKPYTLYRLEQYVRRCYPSDHLVSFSDSAAAVEYIHRKRPAVDLCFTSVKNDGPSGLLIAKALKEQSRQTKIVFTAETNEFALDAWKLGVSDYLLEPLTPDSVEHTLTSCSPCGASPPQTADKQTVTEVAGATPARR